MDINLKTIHSVPLWLTQTMTWLYNQIKFLPPAIEAHVVCKRTENLDQFPHPYVHSLSEASPLRNLWDRALVELGLRPYFGYLVSQAKHCHAQILHSHFGNMGWANMRAARRAKMKHVVTFYGYDVNMLPQSDPVWGHRYARLFAEADLFLCEGPHMAKSLHSLGCPKEKIQIQHLGVELESLPFRSRDLKSDEVLKVLIAGTFREKKGIPYALTALGRFARKYPNLAVTICGDATQEASDIVEKKKILEIVRKYNLTDKVRFLGFQPHWRLIEEAYEHHVFLSPSVTATDGDTEGGAPVTIIEMAASGLPVITTNHCDIPYVLGGEGGGFFAAERDPDGLLIHLRSLISDPSTALEKTVHARRHIESYYDWRTIGRELGEKYRGLLTHAQAEELK